MVTPTSLNGAGCANAVPAASVEARNKPAIKLLMVSSLLRRHSPVGDWLRTLPFCGGARKLGEPSQMFWSAARPSQSVGGVERSDTHRSGPRGARWVSQVLNPSYDLYP